MSSSTSEDGFSLLAWFHALSSVASEDGFSLLAWPFSLSSPASEDGFSLLAWYGAWSVLCHWPTWGVASVQGRATHPTPRSGFPC